MADPKMFLREKRREAPEREPESRKKDFREFAGPYSETVLRRQASRCMDCGVPFCQSEMGCPLHNQIPEWNQLTMAGEWKKALARLHSTNNFPEFTGKLCPAPCESACVLGGVIGEPVSIKGVESSLVDRGFQEGWIRPLRAPRDLGFKAAIVGSGPAGLAAAQQLARQGFRVTVFEKAPKMGGLLRYGIPDFKMEKFAIDRRVDQMEAEGVVFETGVALGEQILLKDLQARFDAVGLALGAERPRDLRVPGRELEGIHFAMDFLTQQNRVIGGEAKASPISATGRSVLILGGGDTGSDCLGTAIRQGAEKVVQLELRSRPPLQRSSETPWPYWPFQLKTSHAHEEGGDREWSFQTEAFEGSAGQVERCVGRRLDTGVAHAFDADLVLLALGFLGTSVKAMLETAGVRVDANGRIQTDANLMTTVPGVFAAGDVRRGASLIVWAIREGRLMAAAMQKFAETKREKGREIL